MKIAFMRSRPGNPDIYAMNADGSSQIRLTNGAAVDGRPGIPIGSSLQARGTLIFHLRCRSLKFTK